MAVLSTVTYSLFNAQSTAMVLPGPDITRYRPTHLFCLLTDYSSKLLADCSNTGLLVFDPLSPQLL